MRISPVPIHEKRRYAIALGTLMLFAASATAGELPDRACCVTSNELQEIGLCVSGPDGLERPAACGESGRCFIAVSGAATGVDPEFGHRSQSAGYLAPRAICSSTFPAQDVQSTLIGGYNIDLFSVFDADQDGDLDLRDVAAFMDTYEPAPKRAQSNARPVTAECCFNVDDQRRIGSCLSGPDMNYSFGACEIQGKCDVGFDGFLEPGDLMLKLCASPLEHEPNESDSGCASWLSSSLSVEFVCNAARDAGIFPFATFDADGDGDFDLLDFATLQVDTGLE